MPQVVFCHNVWGKNTAEKKFKKILIEGELSCWWQGELTFDFCLMSLCLQEKFNCAM